MLAFGAHLVSIWAVDGLTPATEPPTDEDVSGAERLSTTASAERAGVRLSAGPDAVAIVRPGAATVTIATGHLGTVTAVALDDSGRNAFVGTAEGHVVELDLDGRRAIVVRRWSVPDAAAIDGLGWGLPGRLLVRTAAGLWWQPTSCAGCGSDEVLLAAARKHLQGCFLENNVTHVSVEVRRRMGIRMCPLSPEPVAG
jgi:hypothetical protein